MPETGNHLGINEQAITKAVERMIRDASADIELTVQRYLARGEKFPAKIEADLYRALMDLAEQYSVQLTESVWGREIIAAARKGGRAVEGAVFTLSPEQIDVALSNAGHKIKNVLAAGVSEVQDVVAAGIIRGDSLHDISVQVQQRVTVDGGVIDQVRADSIARNEVFGVYRQTSKNAADAEGLDLFQMRGPVDQRTTQICRDHMGEVHTAEEWGAIRLKAGGKGGPSSLEEAIALVFQFGLHYGCRHSFDAVRSVDSPGVERYRKLAERQAEQAAA
jgi:hypothetical protein